MRIFFPIIAIVGLTGPALAEITPIADLQRGHSITVEGVVDRFFDTDEIRLRDASGTVRVYLGPDMLPIESGERIRISGVMDNDIAFNELYAREVTREGGEIITIDRRYE